MHFAEEGYLQNVQSGTFSGLTLTILSFNCVFVSTPSIGFKPEYYWHKELSKALSTKKHNKCRISVPLIQELLGYLDQQKM